MINEGCKLKRNEDGGAISTSDLKNLNSFILEEFEKTVLPVIDDDAGVPKIKHAIRLAIYNIGNVYRSEEDLIDIARIIETVAKDTYIFLEDPNFWPESGILNTLRISTRPKNYSGLPVDPETHELTDNKNKTILYVTDLFLEDAFRNLADIKNSFKLEVTHELINTFIINRDKGELVTSIAGANNNVRELKSRLLHEALEFLKLRNGAILPESIEMFEGKKYTGILRNSQVKMLLNSYELKTVDDIAYMAEHDPEAFKAYKAWFTLKNFDNFVDLLLGSIITINPELKQRELSEDAYTYAEKGGNVITSWRTNDNIVIEEEVSLIILALLNSIPYHKNKVINKVGNDKYILFEDFYRIITKVKSLARNPKSASILINRTEPLVLGIYSRNLLSKDELNLIEDKSLRTLINNMRLNPLVYLKIVFTLLNSDNLMDELNFTEEEKDKCYSIYKGVYDFTSNHSFGGIQHKYNYRALNYYLSITQFADSLSSVDYLQYYMEGDRLLVRSLYDQSSDKVRKNIENIINSLNSRLIIKDTFSEFELEPYEAKIISESEGTYLGLTYTILSDNNDIPGIKVRFNIDSGRAEITSITGGIIADEDLVQLLNNTYFLKFIDLLLHLDFIHNKELLKNLNLVTSHEETPSLEVVLLLITLASDILFNKYISNIVLSNTTGKKNVVNQLRLIYNNKDLCPTYNKRLSEITLVPTGMMPILSRLADALSLVTREALSTQVRDAEGNLLSSLTLSRLLGNITGQWEQILQSNKYTPVTVQQLEEDKYYKDYNIDFNPLLGGSVPLDLAISEPDKDDHRTITLNIPVLQNHYYNKVWTKSRNYKDGSLSSALPEHIFESFDSFVNFCLDRMDLSIKNAQFSNESQGDYVNRINALTLISQEQSSAASTFSLFKPGMFKGHYTAKEFNSLQTHKTQTLFTVAESIKSNFLYDFIGGLMPISGVSEKNIVGNGVVGLLPSVNSDKNTIGRIILDLNTKVKIKRSATGKYEEVAIKDLNSEELTNLTADELYKAYSISYKNIFTDFKKLENWLETVKGIKVIINPDTNFIEFNNYCDLHNQNAKELLLAWTNEFNNTHSTNLRFIDLVHYISKKDGHIKFNNTLKVLLHRYSDPKAMTTFMKYKETELLATLVNEHFEVSLTTNFDDATTTYLLELYPEWVNSKEVSENGTIMRLAETGKMALARILHNGIYYYITSKSDLIKISKALNVDFIKDPHALLNPLYNLKVELHPALNQYNLLDYMLTLEFMIAGVGSHIAHPFKGSIDTSIMWIQPSKIANNTLLLSLNNRLFDADAFILNCIDNYLVEKSFKKGSVDFTKRKNSLLSKWESGEEEDFKRYLLLSWELAKILANEANKILYSSTSLGMKLGHNDFTKVVVNYSDEELNVFKQLVPNSKIINSSKSFGLLLYTDLYQDFNQLVDNEMYEEALRFAAQHKRNVSYTAAMHEFLLNLILGIPTEYNMAIMDDIKADVYTTSGDVDKATPYDGATFVNPWVVYWENWSLDSSRAGTDKKLFIHYYDEQTGTGGIIKTAGFGVTNDRVRNYKFYHTMIKNMTNRRWKDLNGNNLTMTGKGILQDFEGNDVEYGPIYYKKGPHYYVREIVKYAGNNTYNCVETEINQYGNAVGESKETNIIVNSNYELWNLFGGQNSLDFNEEGKLLFSEKSVELTAKACNYYGEKKPGISKVLSAEDIYQPLKHSDIHYMPTIGAVKLGAANINPKSAFYNETTLNFFKVKMLLAGILLDKEHEADKAELSLMTLVVAAACARGFKPEAAKNLYNALYNLTKVGTREFRNELGDITTDVKKFDAAVSHIIMKAIVNSGSSDGDLVQKIAKDILYKMRHDKDLAINEDFAKEIDDVLPYSGASIYRKIISSLTSALTKSGIKTKMPGILSVLCPTHDIIKFYKVPVTINGKTFTKHVRYSELADIFYKEPVDGEEIPIDLAITEGLEVLQENEPEIDNLADIEIGYKYLLTYPDNHQEVVHVTLPVGLTNITGETSFGKKMLTTSTISFEHLRKIASNSEIKIQEWIKDGQDLKSYNVRFADNNGNKYQIADLDIVKDFFSIKEIKDTFDVISSALQILDKYELNGGGVTKAELEKRISLYISTNGFLNTRLSQIVSLISTNPTELLAKLKSQLDIESIKELTNIIKTFSLRALNRLMQLALNGISKDGKISLVFINGKIVTIDKNSIDVSPYGLIMPKTFKSNMGLEDFDSVETILNDPDFFLKRLVKKLNTHVDTLIDNEGNPVNNFHLELKRANGHHIYIRRGLAGSDLTPITIFKRTDSEGNVYRIDEHGKKMYPLYSKDDEVYKDVDGNEIIVTSDSDETVWKDALDNDVTVNPDDILEVNGQYINTATGEEVFPKLNSSLLFYLNNLKYSAINISKGCSKKEFYDVLEKARLSNNKVAQHIAELIDKRGFDKDNKELKASLKYAALRRFTNKLNDYSKILKDPDIDVRELLRLKLLGNEMYTSFKESLKIIAARIPAQNLQSFMAMQVLEYDNPNINTAYVSIFLFYLLGSDLDIDAVSLLTFDIGADGLYEGHSPYFNLNTSETLQASKELPFPTGLKIAETNVVVKHNAKVKATVEDSTLYLLRNLFEDGTVNEGKDNSDKALILVYLPKSNLINLDNPYVPIHTFKFKLNTSTAENIRLLEKLLKLNELIVNNKEYNVRMAKILNDQIFAGKEIITENNIWEFNSYLKKVINDHNEYILKVNPFKRESIIKNYVTSQLYNIISDPINIMQAQSSVDTVTKPAKKLASNSPKATVQHTFTPGNVANKWQSIVENMVGKDGIAICATGLKSYFALTLLYSQILTSNSKEKEKLLFDVTIGGHTYHGLANGFSPNFLSLDELPTDLENYSEEQREELIKLQNETVTKSVLDYLWDLLWASDAAGDMSALLSLSVDNAKDLALAKMNAGTSTLGMYLYGLSIGIPFDNLYKIMTSPLAFRLVELTKGDCFNNDLGTFNISGAIRYLTKEPRQLLSKFRKVSITAENIEDPVQFLLHLLSEKFGLLALQDGANDSIRESLLNKKGILTVLLSKQLASYTDYLKNNHVQLSYAEYLKLVLENELRDKVKEQESSIITSTDPKLRLEYLKYKSLYNQAIDFVELYIDDVYLLKHSHYNNIHGEQSYYSDIDRLAQGAEELKTLGSILHLNLEIKTSPEELIDLVDTIENLITKRITALLGYIKRHPSEKADIINNNKLLNEMLACEHPEKDFGKGGFKVSLKNFISNSSYRRRCIEAYDAIKVSYNPFRVISEVPNYKGYVETLYTAYEGMKHKSIKFSLSEDISNDFIRTWNVTNSSLKELVRKNAEKAITYHIRQMWMLSSPISTLTMPASTPDIKLKDGTVIPGRHISAFVNSLEHTTLLLYDRTIQLGTTVGDANFKYWMEKVIIPELKTRPDLMNNKFILDLESTIGSKTDLGIYNVVMTLPINMLPKSKFEEDKFNEYKKHFNDLARANYFVDAAGKSISLLDLFYLYSLICNEGKLGPTSLHGIFRDYIIKDSSLDTDFRHYISNMDEHLTYYAPKIRKEISDMSIVPEGSPYAGGSRLLRLFDSETDEVILAQKPEEDYSSDEMDDYYDNNLGDLDSDGRDGLINGYIPIRNPYNLNSTNRGYFYHPVAPLLNTEFSTIHLTLEEIDLLPNLGKFNILYEVIKKNNTFVPGCRVIEPIITNDEESKKIAQLVLNHLLKENNGALPLKIKKGKYLKKEINDSVIDLQLLNEIFETIKCVD